MVENKQKGFTIIEVVLVLAIAGLIFMIVFLAVPALQRARRDTQRRSDLSRYVAQLEQYASNNNGKYPISQTQVDAFRTGYMGTDEFSDPSTGSTYRVNFLRSAPTSLGNINYATSAKCDGESIIFSSNARDVAAAIKTENGSAFCQDNR